jgi:hypothetical protein
MVQRIQRRGKERTGERQCRFDDQGLMRQTLTLALKSKHSRYICYRNHVPKALPALLKVVLSPVRLYLSLSSDYLSLYVM